MHRNGTSANEGERLGSSHSKHLSKKVEVGRGEGKPVSGELDHIPKGAAILDQSPPGLMGHGRAEPGIRRSGFRPNLRALIDSLGPFSKDLGLEGMKDGQSYLREVHKLSMEEVLATRCLEHKQNLPSGPYRRSGGVG